jgi:hypothetical protein
MRALTEKEIAAARRRGEHAAKNEPRAIAVWYDSKHDVVIVMLKNGSGMAIPRKNLQDVQNASSDRLKKVSVAGRGASIIFDTLRVGFSVAGLAEGAFGSERWMRSLAARSAGRVKSEAKAAAVRANGTKGGRPKTRAIA